jgi:hypothetical protein
VQAKRPRAFARGRSRIGGFRVRLDELVRQHDGAELRLQGAEALLPLGVDLEQLRGEILLLAERLALQLDARQDLVE